MKHQPILLCKKCHDARGDWVPFKLIDDKLVCPQCGHSINKQTKRTGD